MKPDVASLFRSKSIVIGFGSALALTASIALIQGPKPFYGDSSVYWMLASSFTRHGSFSLLNFASPERGYALPLIYHGLELTVNGLGWSAASVVKLFNAITFAIIGAILAPKLAEIIWPGQAWGLGRRMLLVVLLILFWSGYLNFPLSDFPGLALALLAIIAVSRPTSPGWMLLAGVAAGLAIDVRAAYLLLGPALLVLVAMAWLGERRTARRAIARRILCASLLVGGFATVSLPQSLSAHRYFGTWSFIPGAPLNITHLYLTRGLEIQMSNVDIRAKPSFGMYSLDEAGMRLLSKQKEEQIDSTSEYIRLIVDHPLTMGALFATHIIDGLDQRYSTVYVENLDTWTLPLLRVAGFLLVFIALWRLLWTPARRALGSVRYRYGVALAACAATSVPDQMETRYLLPLYLLCWMVVLMPGWRSVVRPDVARGKRLRTGLTLVAAGLVFTLTTWHVTSGATEQIHIVH